MSWDLAGPAQIAQMGQYSYSRSGVNITPAPSMSGVSAAGTAGVGIGAGAGYIGFPPSPAPQPNFPPILPALAGAGAIAGLVADWRSPDWGLFQNGGNQPQPYGVPFGGPGLKEPGGKYLLKEWHLRQDSKEGDFDLQFYLTQNDRGTKRVFMYNQRTKAWKSWPMPRLAVIGKNMPSHRMITRLRRNLKRQQADATTILKLVAPNKLESTRKPGGRWVGGKKRYID